MRTLDPDLAKTLLAAAKELWIEHGDAGFNLRAVAARAGTTTATLYTRFRSRDDILRALRDASLAKFHEHVKVTNAVAEFCAAYLDFAERFPRDYELMFGSHWRQRTTQTELDRLIGRLVARIDNEIHCGPSRARALAFKIWLLLQGAATERLSSGGRAQTRLWRQIKAACLSGCDDLMRMSAGSGPAKPRRSHVNRRLR